MLQSLILAIITSSWSVTIKLYLLLAFDLPGPHGLLPQIVDIGSFPYLTHDTSRSRIRKAYAEFRQVKFTEPHLATRHVRRWAIDQNLTYKIRKLKVEISSVHHRTSLNHCKIFQNFNDINRLSDGISYHVTGSSQDDAFEKKSLCVKIFLKNFCVETLKLFFLHTQKFKVSWQVACFLPDSGR